MRAIRRSRTKSPRPYPQAVRARPRAKLPTVSVAAELRRRRGKLASLGLPKGASRASGQSRGALPLVEGTHTQGRGDDVRFLTAGDGVRAGRGEGAAGPRPIPPRFEIIRKKTRTPRGGSGLKEAIRRLHEAYRRNTAFILALDEGPYVAVFAGKSLSGPQAAMFALRTADAMCVPMLGVAHKAIGARERKMKEELRSTTPALKGGA
mgnify:FL=1